MVEVGVRFVELDEHFAPLAGHLILTVEKPLAQRSPRRSRILPVIIHLLGHIMYGPCEGDSVTPNVPARTYMSVIYAHIYECHMWVYLRIWLKIVLVDLSAPF